MPYGDWLTASALRRDTVIVACAISAGIHAALAPDHFAGSAGTGLGSVVSAVLLAAFAVSGGHAASAHGEADDGGGGRAAPARLGRRRSPRTIVSAARARDG